ncbi:MAG TPA: peptidase dimerization domain-containing protein [Gemmatimonadales bacterium]|jgi:amidohydrolase|nr:peptidase dimerization domain-containing protein [Gemmatimonadales bacterium]
MFHSVPRSALALAAGATVALAPLAAQTTPTERAAAGAVLKSIDSLQTALAPMGLGGRLVSAKDPERDRLLARTGAIWDSDMQGLSDWIGRNPEVGWKEFRAVDTLVKVLRKNGFTVDTGSAGLPTAFVARWASPAGTGGPMLGLIAEYDALRGTSGAFHGDQHNAQSPVAIAAAVALQEEMTSRKLPGTIVIYGTPAEEIGPPAKAIMRDAGIFKGASILVRSHSTSATARSRAGFGICCLDINEVKYTFTGRPSHQLSSWNGRNALEAAVHFYVAVDGLRSSFRPEASIQGVIPEGGVAPNVVPDRAVVDYYIRYPDGVYLQHISTMMDNAARAAAMATGTEVKIDHYGEYRDGISLGTLEETFFAYAKSLGATRVEPDQGRPAGYEETGGVSLDVPGVGVVVASSTFPNHTQGMLDDAFTAVGHSAFRADAQIMSAMLYHYLTDAAFRDAITREHATLRGLYDQYQANLKKAYASEMEQPQTP